MFAAHLAIFVIFSSPLPLQRGRVENFPRRRGIKGVDLVVFIRGCKNFRTFSIFVKNEINTKKL